jgi:NADH-ubiquinone oxidoreductase chain 5
MLKGMFGLISLVVFGGRILIWLIFPTPYFICLPLLIKFITLFVVTLGAWIGYELAKFSLSYELKSLKFIRSTLFFGNIWNMPFISTFGINYYPLFLGAQIYKNLDQGWSEFFGAQNIFYTIKSSSLFLEFLYNNNLKVYIILLSLWAAFLFMFVYYLNSLYLEHNIEDIREAKIAFKYL